MWFPKIIEVEERVKEVFGLTPLLSIVRLKISQDKYSWCGIITYHWPDTIEIEGVMRHPRLSEVRLMAKHFAPKGIVQAYYDRHKNGVITRHWFRPK